MAWICRKIETSRIETRCECFNIRDTDIKWKTWWLRIGGIRNVSVSTIVSGLSGEGEFSHHVLWVLILMFNKGSELSWALSWFWLGIVVSRGERLIILIFFLFILFRCWIFWFLMKSKLFLVYIHKLVKNSK